MIDGLLKLLFGDLPNHWFHYNPNRLTAKSIVVLSVLGVIELFLFVFFSRR